MLAMPAPVRLRLNQETRAAVATRYEQTRSAIEHSRLVRALLEELRGQLVLVYTPTYDPEANRIEWLWRALRRAVTHTHTRETLPPLLEDADAWARTISPNEILRQIGSPFADVDPVDDQELAHAA
jgi:transposase